MGLRAKMVFRRFSVPAAWLLLAASAVQANAGVCSYASGYKEGRISAAQVRANGFEVIDAIFHTPSRLCTDEIEPTGACSGVRAYTKGYQCGYSAIKRQKAERNAELVVFIVTIPLHVLKLVVF